MGFRDSGPGACARVSIVARLAVVLLGAPLGAQAPRALSDSAFADLVARLSEPSGYFDTDNLISNEDSYLHVVGTLKRLGVAGGAYVGVGPDQSFSYIAAIHPRIAFIIDIRRDNLLQHVMFKSMFALARNRLEYLCLLFGKSAPDDTAGWGARDIAALLEYVDAARFDTAIARRSQARVLSTAKHIAIPLSTADLATIARFHATFVAQGPALRFNTLGRPPQAYYPDLRRLLTETDRTGRQSSYLAHEADFQFVKALEEHNLVVPVVGDLGGDKALNAIGQWLRANRETVSALYTSNVEQYLFQGGTFGTFARNAIQLPHTGESVMIRSYFMGGHPQNVPGYHATQVAQLFDRFGAVQAAGGFGSYYALVTRDIVTP